MKRLLGLLTATLLLCLAPSLAHAFCVNNHTDQSMFVEQVGPHSPARGLKATIPPNGQACCNWQDTTCNPGASQSAMLEIATFTENQGPVVGNQPSNWRCGHAPTSITDSSQWNYNVPASGWVDILKPPPAPPETETQRLMHSGNSAANPDSTYIVRVYAAGGAQVAAWPCASM